MKQTEKLKVVFDFIAEYLSDSESEIKVEDTSTKELITEGEVVTKNEDSFSRAYEIMKKIEGIDAIKFSKLKDVKNTMLADEVSSLRSENNDLLKILKRREYLDRVNASNLPTNIKDIINEEPRTGVISDVESSTPGLTMCPVEKMGITLDDEGKLVRVSYKPLTENRGEIEAHINEIINSEKKKN